MITSLVMYAGDAVHPGLCMCADAVSMWAVPPEQRPSSQALLVITMHLCGDVPAPPLVGALQGELPTHTLHRAGRSAL